MNQQQRINDFQNALRIAFKTFALQLRCASPGIVRSFDASNGTATIVLAIQGAVFDANGNETQQAIRPLVDVPVVFLGGGNFVSTFPVQPGDEALVIFADRCIDSWFQSGGEQGEAEPRAHDLSDGIAIVGPRSLARLIPNLSTTTAQFRSLDGSTYFEVAANGEANVVAPSGVTITGPVTIKGDLSVVGTMTGSANMSIDGEISATGEGTFAGIPVSTHVHGGVQTGGGNTGTPIA
ncbi:MAG: Gp138 family membrane-puncturing spike protein [Acidobacteriota bacterium]